MNRKAFTLVEIIVSITLISLIMLFLFRLLVLIQSEDTLNSDDTNINVTTSLLISEIQDDFLTNEVKYVYKPTCIDSTNKCCCASGTNDCLKIYYQTGDVKELSIYNTTTLNDSIRYNDVSRVLPSNYSFLSFGAYNMVNQNKFIVEEIGQGKYLSVPNPPPIGVNYDVDSLLIIKIPLYKSNIIYQNIEIKSKYSCQNIKDEFGGANCDFLRPACPQ